ncbi:MAG: hypothetical protein IT518_15585 [Burkholderiales bacterium]|nr:hypothetical protein [Burkholderiales bacterium]
MPDPAYLADVSSAFVAALQEAQGMISAGEVGAPLADVVRHARELHEIMVEELVPASRATGEYAGGMFLELGERLSALERYLQGHRH